MTSLRLSFSPNYGDLRSSPGQRPCSRLSRIYSATSRSNCSRWSG
jgi:hypothetical protein